MNSRGYHRIWLRLTALLHVTLWLPASSHAWLETSGYIHGHECAALDSHHDHATSHGAADGHCRRERGDFLVKVPALAAQPYLLAWAKYVAAWLNRSEREIEPVVHPRVAPLEMVKVWQFAQRTALPSRAPSFVA